MQIIHKTQNAVSLQKEDGNTKAFSKFNYDLDVNGNSVITENTNLEQELIDFGASAETINEIKELLDIKNKNILLT